MLLLLLLSRNKLHCQALQAQCLVVTLNLTAGQPACMLQHCYVSSHPAGQTDP
jgi:hypothetical protein